MNPATIIEQASAAGVSLSVAGGKLAYQGPTEAVRRLLPLLAEHKAELVETLSGCEPKAKPPFWAVFGLGGPTACWRVTDTTGDARIVAFWPQAVAADVQRMYPGCNVEQLFTEDERQALLGSALRRERGTAWAP